MLHGAVEIKCIRGVHHSKHKYKDKSRAHTFVKESAKSTAVNRSLVSALLGAILIIK
jgi:hypothetical protein